MITNAQRKSVVAARYKLLAPVRESELHRLGPLLQIYSIHAAIGDEA